MHHTVEKMQYNTVPYRGIIQSRGNYSIVKYNREQNNKMTLSTIECAIPKEQKKQHRRVPQSLIKYCRVQ